MNASVSPSAVEWGDPPPAAYGAKSALYADAAAALRTRPGEWAKVASDLPPSTASQIRSGRYKAFPKGEFEITHRKVDGSDLRDVWARYIGGAS